MHTIDRAEPAIGHVQFCSHVTDHLECFTSRFESLALARLGVWLPWFWLGAHEAIWIHPRKVDAVDARECDCIHCESDDRCFHEGSPFLACANEVHNLSSRPETFARTLSPEARWHVELVCGK